jgi:hypothetical protein
MRTAEIEVVRLKTTQKFPRVFVITAYKDGGAMGFDEFDIVSAHDTETAAMKAAESYVAAREDRRWWPTIREMMVRT